MKGFVVLHIALIYNEFFHLIQPAADKYAKHFQFRLYNDRNSVILAATSQNDAVAWVKAIQYVIDRVNNRGRRPPQARANVHQLPSPAQFQVPRGIPYGVPAQISSLNQHNYPVHSPHSQTSLGTQNIQTTNIKTDQLGLVAPPQNRHSNHQSLNIPQKSGTSVNVENGQRPQVIPVHDVEGNAAAIAQELSHLAIATTNPGRVVSEEQYKKMQQRIAFLTTELKKYKYRYEQDNNDIDKDQIRRQHRHTKGKKNTF